MASVQLTKKNLSAILVGLAVVVLIGIVTSTISFFLNSHIVRPFSVYDFKSVFIQQIYLPFNWFLRITSFLSPIIGGFVVGRMVKNNRLFYGSLLGVVIVVISICIVSLTFFLPTSIMYGEHFSAGYARSLTQKNIVNQLLHFPLTILLTAFGGYLSDFIHKRPQKKK